jgi:RNA polymerase sigma factor (sigma-70 family)
MRGANEMLKTQPSSVDSALIQRCLKGDADSWADLIRRYERLIYSVARVLCPEESSDVFQQVCLELYERLGDLRDEATLPKWLITVTRRKCYAAIREKRDNETFEATFFAASTEIERIERQHAIDLSLNQLPEKCRTLVTLLYRDELSYEDISIRLDMPVSSIGPTRARCLAKLKKMLG